MLLMRSRQRFTIYSSHLQLTNPFLNAALGIQHVLSLLGLKISYESKLLVGTINTGKTGDMSLDIPYALPILTALEHFFEVSVPLQCVYCQIL